MDSRSIGNAQLDHDRGQQRLQWHAQAAQLDCLMHDTLTDESQSNLGRGIILPLKAMKESESVLSEAFRSKAGVAGGRAKMKLFLAHSDVISRGWLNEATHLYVIQQPKALKPLHTKSKLYTQYHFSSSRCFIYLTTI